MNDSFLIKAEKWIFLAFLSLFAGLGVYLRLKTMNAPILPFLHEYDILPHLNSSFGDILLSDYHRLINIYRNTISNILYQQFGVNEVTSRVFPVVIALLTFIFVYLFTLKTLGKNEAALALLLAGVSYFSIHNSMKPMYGSFYVYASFMTFYFLWKSFEEGRWINWFGFASFNFLNLTESLLSGIFLPALFLVGLILAKYEFKYAASVSQAKEKFYYFIILFFISIAFALTLYQVRNLNLIQQVWNIIFSNSIGSELANDNSLHIRQIDNLAFGFLNLLTEVFSKLNFEYYEFKVSEEIHDYLHFAHLIYFALFLTGLFALYKKNEKLFWCFFVISALPLLISAFILKLTQARYLACVLPFYWITVSVGFLYLFSFLKFLEKSRLLKNIVPLLTAFLVFSWFLHPKPLWSSKYQDEMFHMQGIRTIASYLKENIHPNDVILNITDQVRLDNFSKGPISYGEYKFYLEPFFDKHRLTKLLERTGKIGVWVILQEPIKDKKFLPYFFPQSYLPRLVKKVNGFALHYEEIVLSNDDNAAQPKVFSTPFWLFMKGLYHQKKGERAQAEPYYHKMVEHGFNIDRAYYNIGVLKSYTNIDKGILYLRKAIKELETPTILPKNAHLGNISILNSKNDKKMLSLINGQKKGLRYYFRIINERKYKVFFREDFLKISSPKPYSEYYMTASIFLYFKYLKTNDQRLLKEAQIYITNALKLNPNHESKEFSKFILDAKSIYTPEKKLNIPLGNLNYIREEFPDILIK